MALWEVGKYNKGKTEGKSQEPLHKETDPE